LKEGNAYLGITSGVMNLLLVLDLDYIIQLAVGTLRLSVSVCVNPIP
jgi:hypothetical protein